jgi:hypothetical protein
VLDFFPLLLFFKNTSPGERTFYTLFSGPAEQAPIETDGEIYLWREDFDFFEDATSMARRPDEADTIRDDDGNDDHMTLVADCLGLGRGLQLVTEPTHEALGNERRDNHHCRVPTPEKNLSGILRDVPFGFQQTPRQRHLCGSVMGMHPTSIQFWIQLRDPIPSPNSPRPWLKSSTDILRPNGSTIANRNSSLTYRYVGRC